MKRVLLALTLASLTSWGFAQSPPNRTDPGRTPPATEPSSSMQDPSTDGTANYSNGSDDEKLQMKACLAKQHQANPQSSPDEMRRKCAKLKPKDPDSH